MKKMIGGIFCLLLSGCTLNIRTNTNSTVTPTPFPAPVAPVSSPEPTPTPYEQGAGTANSTTYQYEPWKFTMQISADYTKTKDNEITSGSVKGRGTTYTSTSGKITIWADQSAEAGTLRTWTLNLNKNIEQYQGKNQEQLSEIWGVIEPGTTIISQERFSNNGCIGVQLTDKKAGTLRRELHITSTQRPDMYLTVTFEYPESQTSEIEKTVATIQCGN